MLVPVPPIKCNYKPLTLYIKYKNTLKGENAGVQMRLSLPKLTLKFNC